MRTPKLGSISAMVALVSVAGCAPRSTGSEKVEPMPPPDVRMSPRHPQETDLRRWAEEYLAKPKVALKGFYEVVDAGKLFALVEVTYPMTGQRAFRQVAVGDEFDGYKCERVLPNRNGVILQYIKTGKHITLLLHDGAEQQKLKHCVTERPPRQWSCKRVCSISRA